MWLQTARSSTPNKRLAAISIKGLKNLSSLRSGPRHVQRTGLPRLRGEADRRIGGAKSLIVAALDDLEEKPLVENVGVDLKEFAVALAVVQDLVVAKRRHRRRIELIFGFEIVVVIVGNFQEVRPSRARVRNARENIGA